MMQLMPRKKYIGKVVKWNAEVQKGTLVTSWGLEVEFSGDEILGRFDTEDTTALFYVVFQKSQKPQIVFGGAAA